MYKESGESYLTGVRDFVILISLKKPGYKTPIFIPDFIPFGGKNMQKYAYFMPCGKISKRLKSLENTRFYEYDQSTFYLPRQYLQVNNG